MATLRCSRLVAVAGLSIVLTANPARAITFTETRDAGERLSDAVTVFSGQTMPLTSISGSLAGDADLFRIFLTGGQTFSATTINSDTLLEIPIDDSLGNPTNLLRDPQLFLFDADGNGVYGNDDSFGSLQATLPSFSFAPVEAGIFFLAISSADYDPISTGGEIFLDAPSDGVFAPTGLGGGAPLTGFTGTSTTSGRYTIALTGAQTVSEPARVPEPTSVLGMLSLCAWGAIARLQQTTHQFTKRQQS